MEHFKLILLISAFVLPFAFAITLLLAYFNDIQKRIVGITLLNASIVFLANYFYFQKMYAIYSSIHSLHIATVLWIFPSLYICIRTITNQTTIQKKELLHLLPGLIFGLVSASLFYGLLDSNERVFYLANYRGGIKLANPKMNAISIFRLIDVMMIIAQIIFYSVAFIRISSLFKKRLNNEFSNTENYSIDWMKKFTLMFLLVGFSSIWFYVFNPVKESNDLMLCFFFFFISLFIWIIGIWILKQQKPEIDFTILVQHSSDDNEEFPCREEILLEKLLHHFEKDKPYLVPNLNLTTVAQNLGTNRSYLSALINNKFEINFNSFVNQYRVDFIENQLKNNLNVSKDELIFSGGFGSISSFKRAVNNRKDIRINPNLVCWANK